MAARWALGDGSRLSLVANLGGAEEAGFTHPAGKLLHAQGAADGLDRGMLPAWSAAFFLREAA